MGVTVGAALYGRPFVDFHTGAATEGRPYSTFDGAWNLLGAWVSNLHYRFGGMQMTAPTINVTPLIDVLLVLLIIFMVAAPMKPHRFLTKLPAIPHNDPRIEANINTLVVTIEEDRTLKLNNLSDMGTVDDLSPLSAKLKSVFEERLRNRAYRPDLVARVDLPESQRVEKTIFIKAPRNIPYGEVVRVMDGLKGIGADPIGLQLNELK